MKKVLVLLAICSLGFHSCKKKIYGCMDSTALNYSNVATEESNSCIYDNVYSSTLNNVSWNYTDPSYETTLSWTEIDQEVIDSGALNVYVKLDGTAWSPVPLTFYQNSTYATTIEVGFGVGFVKLYWTDSDLTQPNTPPSNISVKVVISK